MHQSGHPGHVLRVPAIDMNNNTEFGCTIYLASKIISSQYCYLKIQDNNETTMVLDKKNSVYSWATNASIIKHVQFNVATSDPAVMSLVQKLRYILLLQ